MENLANDQAARAVQFAVEGNATEMSKQISYMVGNATLKALNIKKDVTSVVSVGSSIQAGYSIGTTSWKAMEDISRNDRLCTGLCLIATGCELVAFTASSCAFVPNRLKVYGAAKAASTGLMRFRNLCFNAQGHQILC